MRDYLLARLAIFLTTVIGAAVLLFLVLDILPNAAGSDRPAGERFLALLIGDTGSTPNLFFADRLAVTLPLALLALLLALAVGLGLGLMSSRHDSRLADRFARAAAAILALVPPFWLGMLLALLFAGLLQLLPANGFVPWSNVPGALASLLLPALALGLPHAGQLALTIRRETAANAPDALARLLPQLPQLAAHAFAAMLIGAALVESVFFLPGLGRQIIGAAEQHDLVLLRGALFVLIAVAACGTLLLSLLRLPLDPALRTVPGQ